MSAADRDSLSVQVLRYNKWNAICFYVTIELCHRRSDWNSSSSIAAPAGWNVNRVFKMDLLLVVISGFWDTFLSQEMFLWDLCVRLRTEDMLEPCHNNICQSPSHLSPCVIHMGLKPERVMVLEPLLFCESNVSQLWGIVSRLHFYKWSPRRLTFSEVYFKWRVRYLCSYHAKCWVYKDYTLVFTEEDLWAACFSRIGFTIITTFQLVNTIHVQVVLTTQSFLD